MNFGEVLEKLKNEAKKAYREGWNDIQAGKEMYIELVHTDNSLSKYKVLSRIDMIYEGEDPTRVVGWLASQTDMLAEDWELIK